MHLPEIANHCANRQWPTWRSASALRVGADEPTAIGERQGPYHASRLRSRILEDHVRTLLRDHERRRVGVAGHEEWHDGGVDNAQRLYSSHAQARIDHRRGVAAHLARAGRVERDPAALPQEIQEIRVALARRTRIVLA